MSFTSNIKNEISNIEYGHSEKMAELSAALNIGVKIYDDRFEIYTENVSVARRLYKLIKEIYHVDIDMDTSGSNSLRGNKLVLLIVKNKNDFILEDLSILENGKRIYIPSMYLVDEDKDKQAYLRGVFMMCGSINDPKTSRYHAEFVINNESSANYVNKLLNEFYFNSKVIRRDKTYMVYIKEAEKISDFIKMLNATSSLFYYEDIRIYRDHKNMTNRLNNCEQANVDKIIETANNQVKDIELIDSIGGMDLLDEKVKVAAIYRMKYKEASLLELSEIISIETGVPITKSGLHHRFTKIRDLANKVRSKEVK